MKTRALVRFAFLAAVAAVAAVGALVAVPYAQAHPYLAASTPEAGGTLPAGSSVVALRFTELFERDQAVIELSTDSGPVAVQVQAPRTRPLELRVTTEPLAPGPHDLNWQVVGADGHRASGHIRFGVDVAVAAAADAGSGDVAGTWLRIEAIGRAAMMTGLMGALGMPLFVREVARVEPPRRIATAVVALAALALMGSCLVLAAIAHASSGAVAATSAAQRIGLQVILIAASGAIAWRARRRPTLLVISALPAFLALVAHSTGGHGVLAPGTQGVAGHVGMTAHLVAAGLWAGGIVGLLLLLPAPVATVAEWIRRFSPLALVCAIVVALTGLQQAIDHIPSGASGGLYVRLLWLKAGLLAALLAFGGWHLWVALPHIEGRRRRWGAAHSTTTLRRSLPTDAAIMVLVLLVAGVLAAVAPPAAPPDASGPRAVNEVDGILGDYTATVALLADPVWSGQPHWLEVTLLERSSRSASLAILEAGRTDPNGTHQAIALERGASNWTAPLTFDAPGTWVVSLRLLGPTRGELLLPVRIQEMPT